MLAREMKGDRQYRLLSGEVVVFSRIGATGKMIVHPPGDPDMQSSTALEPTEVVEEAAPISKATTVLDREMRQAAEFSVIKAAKDFVQMTKQNDPEGEAEFLRELVLAVEELKTLERFL